MFQNLDFSVWCDFVERSFLEGEFKDLLAQKIINGATSNPSIFKSSFLNSPAYSKDRKALAHKDAKEVYETLAIADIKSAAQKMYSLYEAKNDGFISIEVDPFLCDDAPATISEGKRLYEAIGFENVMIKVPATPAGYLAMEALMREGISVNATLIFSPQQAQKSVEAFKNALEYLQQSGQDKRLPQGVVSVFVSRFDSKLDASLHACGMPQAKVGIMNAIKIYDIVESFGLANVRTLFASTGVKRDDLDAAYYVKELLFAHAINTAPLGTIKAFIASGHKQFAKNKKEYIGFFEELEKNGIDMQKVYDELTSEGLVAFKKAFEEILEQL